MYAASKYAVLGFSQSLASMYETTGVRMVIMCPGSTLTALVANPYEKVHDSIHAVRDIFKKTLQEASPRKHYFQTPDNVRSAMLNLIQKGKNGAVWVNEENQPPYAVNSVNFPHYSKRAQPV